MAAAHTAAMGGGVATGGNVTCDSGGVAWRGGVERRICRPFFREGEVVVADPSFMGI